jgi:hypothetical protein
MIQRDCMARQLAASLLAHIDSGLDVPLEVELYLYVPTEPPPARFL